MKNHLWVKLSVLPISMLALNACNAPLEQKSNLTSVDAKQAANELNQRLEKTIRIRELAKSIENALRPVDGALNDVKKLLNLEKDRLESELPGFAVSELRYALQSLTQGMVETQKDGSWVVERQVKWPFERYSPAAYNCDKTQFGISAQSSPGDEQHVVAEVYVRDCSLAQKTVVAHIERTSNGKITTEFNGSALDILDSNLVSADRCNLEVKTKDGVEVNFSCAPFATKVSNVTLNFSGIEYASNSLSGESLSMNVSAVKANGTQFAEVAVSQAPGQKIQVKLTRTSSL